MEANDDFTGESETDSNYSSGTNNTTDTSDEEAMDYSSNILSEDEEMDYSNNDNNSPYSSDIKDNSMQVDELPENWDEG